jgi:hypothetical protein
MKQEVINFYKENNTPMEKLIAIGMNRRGLTLASVISGAEQLYSEIQDGLQVLPVRIAWEVFSRAKVLKGTVEKKELDKTIELENENAVLRAEYGILELNMKHEINRKEAELMAANLALDVIRKGYLKLQEIVRWYEQPWWKTIFRRPV